MYTTDVISCSLVYSITKAIGRNDKNSSILLCIFTFVFLRCISQVRIQALTIIHNQKLCTLYREKQERKLKYLPRCKSIMPLFKRYVTTSPTCALSGYPFLINNVLTERLLRWIRNVLHSPQLGAYVPRIHGFIGLNVNGFCGIYSCA